MSEFTSVWLKEELEDVPFDPLSLVALKHEDDNDDDDVEEVPLKFDAPSLDAVKHEIDDYYDCETGVQPFYNEPDMKKEMSKKRKSTKSHYKRPTKILKCDNCEYSTVYRSALVTHIRSDHENKYFKCPHCMYASKYEFTINRHVLQQHIEGEVPIKNGVQLPLIKCEECEYKTYYEFNYKLHLRKHSKDRKYQCNSCNFKTSYRHSLRKHMKKHEMKKNTVVYKCDRCTFVTKHTGIMQRHLATIHNVVLDSHNFCPYCSFSTRLKWRLNIHTKRMKHDVEQKCARCDFKSFYKCQMKMHKVTHKKVTHNKKYNKIKIVNEDSDATNQSYENCDDANENITDNDVYTVLNPTDTESTAKIKEDMQATVLNRIDTDINNFKSTVKNRESMQATVQNHTDMNYFDSTVENKESMQKFSEPSCSFNEQYLEYAKFLETDPESFDNSEIPMSNDNSEAPINTDNSDIPMNTDNYDTPMNIDNSKGLLNNDSMMIPMKSDLCKFKPDDRAKHIKDTKFSINKNTTDNSQKKFHFINLEKTKRSINKEALCNQYMFNPKSVEGVSIQVLGTKGKNKQFQCGKCEYSSKFKCAVIKHYERQHSGTRPYNCCNCDFSTRTKDQIGLHNKRSKSDILLYCGESNECDFNTYYKCQLNMHIQSHYRYKCTQCPYSSRHQRDLNRHYKEKHTGNRLQCRYCDYEAARGDSVLAHESMHTGEKPHKCAHCKYSSVRKYLLDIHMKMFHNELREVQIFRPNELQSKIKSLEVKVLQEK